MVKVAILHEGKADEELLNLLLKDLNLDIDNIEFFRFGSKSNFFKLDNPKYKRLKLQIEEEAIGKVLFVVDADYESNDKVYGGFSNTKDRLDEVIKKLDMENMADSYITCDPQTKDGYLESLILSSISQNQKECIETFLDCSEFKSKDNHKSILNEIYKIAYPTAPYDFSHGNFDELKQKLKHVLNI